MDSAPLTTGEVARLCGVTPDAVLKWIKKGKLPAARTPGGHYRVARTDLAALGIGVPAGDGALRGRPATQDCAGPGQAPDTAVRCWEYFSARGTVREVCRECLVYRARARNCYELATLGEQAGHRRNFCPTESCDDCRFFRSSHGMAVPVLVLTRDNAAANRLASQLDESHVALRFARTGYEASAAVADLRPAVIVMDGDLPEVRDGSLPEAMLRDDRVARVELAMWGREVDRARATDLGLTWIPAPVTARQIEELATQPRRLPDVSDSSVA